MQLGITSCLGLLTLALLSLLQDPVVFTESLFQPNHNFYKNPCLYGIVVEIAAMPVLQVQLASTGNFIV